jgi:hypothetical protein
VKVCEIKLNNIDYLVNIGRYKNRSQAILNMFDEKLATEALPLDFKDKREYIKCTEIVAELKKIPAINFKSVSRKPLAETIAEERERS